MRYKINCTKIYICKEKSECILFLRIYLHYNLNELYTTQYESLCTNILSFQFENTLIFGALKFKLNVKNFSTTYYKRHIGLVLWKYFHESNNGFEFPLYARKLLYVINCIVFLQWELLPTIRCVKENWTYRVVGVILAFPWFSFHFISSKCIKHSCSARIRELI